MQSLLISFLHFNVLLQNERVLSFVPPDGNFRLLSYHIGSQKYVNLCSKFAHFRIMALKGSCKKYVYSLYSVSSMYFFEAWWQYQYMFGTIYCWSQEVLGVSNWLLARNKVWAKRCVPCLIFHNYFLLEYQTGCHAYHIAYQYETSFSSRMLLLRCLCQRLCRIAMSSQARENALSIQLQSSCNGTLGR